MILTRDTDSFMVGEPVFVGGTLPGKIAYIGETKFAGGDWAGVVLERPFGRSDGASLLHPPLLCHAAWKTHRNRYNPAQSCDRGCPQRS